MPRGGRRAGSPGKAYGNRTDLQGGTPLPATAATGQPYGAAGQQIAAQKIVPMAGTPVPAPPQTDPAAPTGPMPGELTPLTAPSERPNEPVTHGLPVGAGAGPEVLPQPMSPALKGLAILNSLGDQLSPELKQVAQYLTVRQSGPVNW